MKVRAIVTWDSDQVNRKLSAGLLIALYHKILHDLMGPVLQHRCFSSEVTVVAQLIRTDQQDKVGTYPIDVLLTLPGKELEGIANDGCRLLVDQLCFELCKKIEKYFAGTKGVPMVDNLCRVKVHSTDVDTRRY